MGMATLTVSSSLPEQEARALGWAGTLPGCGRAWRPGVGCLNRTVVACGNAWPILQMVSVIGSGYLEANVRG